MPQAAGEDEVREIVVKAVADLAASSGAKPGPRDMGAVMKTVMAKFHASGARVDGKVVSEAVKRELTPKAQLETDK